MATEAEEVAQAEAEDKEATEAEESEAKAEEEENQEAEEDEQQEVVSTMVASWGYNAEAEELEVIFLNGHEESYSCTADQWSDAQAASSVGKWMHENVL